MAMLTPWESTVANAVPPAPRPTYLTKRKSSRILTTQATPTKYMGRTESP